MKKIVIISGISGAGKSTAANILEDMGYLCIDQYPVELLDNLVELIVNDDSVKYQKVALTIPLSDLDKYDKFFDNSEIESTLILLDASTETIIKRYKFTRRVHPLLISNIANSLEEAVEIEKNWLEYYRNRAFGHVLDTTNLSFREHKETLDRILSYDDFNNLAVSFISFGYKYGVPGDADLIFDVRILDNPFWVEELRDLNGNDEPVYNYVLNGKHAKEYLDKLISYIDFTLQAYDKEEKRHLTICVGCTGGKHRSVTITNYLYDHYKEEYLCYKKHRELEEKS